MTARSDGRGPIYPRRRRALVADVARTVSLGLVLASACGPSVPASAPLEPVTEEPVEPAAIASIEPSVDGPCRAGELLATFEHEGYDIAGVGFSPDGALLVTHGPGKPTQVWDGWSFEPSETLAQVRGAGLKYPIIFTADRHLVMADGDNAYILELGSGRVLARFDAAPRLLAIQLSPSGSYLLTTTRSAEHVGSGDLAIWAISGGEPLGVIPNSFWVIDVAVSTAEDRIVAYDHANRLIAYTFPEGVRLGPVIADKRALEQPAGMAFLPGDRRLAIQTIRGKFAVVDLDDGALEVTEIPMGKAVCPAAGLLITPDATRIAGLTDNGQGWLWDVEGRTLIATFDFGEFPHEMTSAALTHDGRRLFVGGNRGTLRAWGTQTGEELPALDSAPGKVHALAVSPDNTRLAVAHVGGASVRCIAEAAAPSRSSMFLGRGR